MAEILLKLQWALLVVAFIAIAWLVRRTIQKAKELNIKIDEYHREQEAIKKLQQEGLVGPIDPYAELADLYKEKKEEEKDR